MTKPITGSKHLLRNNEKGLWAGFVVSPIKIINDERKLTLKLIKILNLQNLWVKPKLFQSVLQMLILKFFLIEL